jgi:hypothetical protein
MAVDFEKGYQKRVVWTNWTSFVGGGLSVLVPRLSIL